MTMRDRFLENFPAMAFKLPWQSRTALAIVSFVKRATGNRLFNASENDAPDVVKAMGWREFESLICGVLREEGYRVDERGGSRPDGEIDLIATKARKRLLVLCKHWKTQQVGASVIRDLNGIVAARRADGGIVVTGGIFTKEAHDLAEGCQIRLIDGGMLEQIIVSQQSSPRASVAPTVPAAPRCPKCAAGMVDRVAMRGKFAGKHFWACSRYPTCTGIASALESDKETRQSRSAA